MSKRLIWISAAVLAVAFAVAGCRPKPPAQPSAEFTQLMTRGNGLLEKGDAAGAIELYAKAQQLSPQSTDVRLNLANAHLLANQPDAVVPLCRQVLELDPNNAAAHYLLGCALLRLNQPEPAAQALQQSWKIDPAVPALDFQMGMAQKALGQIPDAIRDFEGVIRAVPDHPSAHYQLSQLYRRTGRNEDATRALQEHQRILAQAGNAPASDSVLEQCKYTRPLAPFVLAQPDARGIPVRFADHTAGAFGAAAANARAPLAVIDLARDGRPSLFVRDQTAGFQLLDNQAGRFSPLGRPVRTPATGGYRSALVGDLDNDGFDDVMVLGEQDSRVFKLYAQGRMRDATRTVGLDGLKAAGGLLADLHFTGNLDLVTIQPDGSGLGLYRNLGNFYFDPNWADSGLPKSLPHAAQVTTIDWNNEGLPGVLLTRSDAAPVYYAKKRAAAFAETDLTRTWPAGGVLETADLDNDLRAEAVIATPTSLEIVRRDSTPRTTLPLGGFQVAGLLLWDFDNDGWLDLAAYGANGLRVWRNVGQAGFVDVTRDLALDAAGPIDGAVAADFDNDGDTDFVTTSPAGIRFWRNDGGNQNQQLKLRLAGNRSNASALGVRVELIAGNWRTSRTVRRIPLEIGVGPRPQLDALKVHWFDLSTAQVDVPVGREIVTVKEPTLPTGSCPYLYVWDGSRFKFVTDILGAAPLGLPMNEQRYVPADEEELLALGDDTKFPARNGAYEVRITDELREVLYLDEAHLIAVDHPAGTVVHPTSKMMPSPPFPPHELWTLRVLATPRHAVRSDGLEVTAALGAVDQQMASPVQLRRPQLRGLAEPHSITLDFGTLPAGRPLVLALAGWIHFGGGMANIAGSIDPTMPFPFPQLEAEAADGSWRKVDVVVGTPAGKTKTILVDLNHKLPAGTRRLRLSCAYEIHWDCVQLCEKTDGAQTRQHALTPSRTELRGRGYARYADLPASLPRTPLYDDVVATPPWDHTPGGWFTRYGAVDGLVAKRDDQLVLLAGGDELALSFDAAQLPPVASGIVRDYFLHVVGWDKDADFHVGTGWQVEPLPFRGMDPQLYGTQPRPPPLDDPWMKTFNTRWVSPDVVAPGGKVQPTRVPRHE